MRNTDIASACICALQVVSAAVSMAYILLPQWFARLVSDAFLIRYSLWDECDGDPMNMWAEEFLRRDQPKEPK